MNQSTTTEEITRLLESTLSSDPNQRIKAELDLVILFKHPATPISLLHLLSNPSTPLPIRQSSISLLQKYILEYWSPHFKQFKNISNQSQDGTGIDENGKKKVREGVLMGLGDGEGRIRKGLARLASLIASSDFPDSWPDLTDQLLALLGSSPSGTTTGAGAGAIVKTDPYKVEGALRVLDGVVGTDLAEDQLIPLARIMLPRLEEIFQGSGEDGMSHSPSTRSLSVLVFRQCVQTLYMVKDNHPQAVKSAVAEILPRWLNSFEKVLRGDVGVRGVEGRAGGVVVGAVYRTLYTIESTFPSSLSPFIPSFLSLSLSLLSSLHPLYRSTHLNSSLPQPPPSQSSPHQQHQDSEIDTEDPETDIRQTLVHIFEWLTTSGKRVTKGAGRILAGVTDGGDAAAGIAGAAAGKKKAVVGRDVTPEMRVAVELAVGFARITEDNEETWISDPSAMIADEDDEQASVEVRVACLEFLDILLEYYQEPAVKALWAAFESQLAQAESDKAAGFRDWWKAYEACLAVTGSVSEELIDYIEAEQEAERKPIFDLERVFNGVVLPFLNVNDLPFLQGRAFVFSSQFTKILPQEQASQYVDAGVTLLARPDVAVPVKVSAVKAVKNFFRDLPSTLINGRNVQVIINLTPLVGQTSDNVQNLIIETLQSAINAQPEAITDETVVSLMCESVLTAWMGQPQDPLLVSAVSDIFRTLATSSESSSIIFQVLLTKALPFISNAMKSSLSNPNSPLSASSVNIVKAVLEGLPLGLGGQAVFDGFAAALFDLMMASGESYIVQEGLICFTVVVRKDVNQLLAWRDPSTSQTAFDRVFQIVSRLLDPSQSESAGLFVGDLVVHLLRKAGQSILPVLGDLLKAFCVRLGTAKLPTFIQSLLMPFAYLIQAGEIDTVLDLVENLEVPPSEEFPAPRNGLEVLLNAWCDNVQYFQGYWNIRVSIVAISRLLLSPRPSLKQIKVKGDEILTEANSNTIMTRSRAKTNPPQYAALPFPVKAMKILIRELDDLNEAALGDKDADAEIGSDDGDEDWEDDEIELKRTGDADLALLSDMLGASGARGLLMDDLNPDGDSQQDDQDLKDDPVYSMNIQQHLVTVLKEMVSNNAGAMEELGGYLYDGEKNTLTKVMNA